MRLTSVTTWGLAGLKAIWGRRGLVYLAAATALLILVGGSCITVLEPGTVKGGYGDGIWWAVVTVSTVGYSDISPSTLWGRVVAVALMLTGMGLMSTLAASITSHFVQQTAHTEFKDLTARLERIERTLEQLTQPQDGAITKLAPFETRATKKVNCRPSSALAERGAKLEDQYDMKNFVQYWRLPIVLFALGVTGSGEVIHSGESIFVINVKGGRGVTFHGSYLAVTGTGRDPEEHQSRRAQRRQSSGWWQRALHISASKTIRLGKTGGTSRFASTRKGRANSIKNRRGRTTGNTSKLRFSRTVPRSKSKRTDAPYGVVSHGTAEPSGGPPIQTEYRVDGSVKFAMLTLTSERGDIEQELVPIPFTKEFFPREGWAVGLTAQKIRVTRADPLQCGADH